MYIKRGGPKTKEQKQDKNTGEASENRPFWIGDH
jgi:hypothetical protein